MPVKNIPDFLPMREELYGNTDAFPAAVSVDHLPKTEELPALLSNPGYLAARAAFDKLFLPFSQPEQITETARRTALSSIRIGEAFPFPPAADTDACIAAVMNHLSKRYLEEERTGEAVSTIQEQQVITFGEPVFSPVERPFWQKMRPYVQKEKEQYQALVKRNEETLALCDRLTADLSRQQKLAQEFSGKTAAAPEQHIRFSDPISIAAYYPQLDGTPVAERLRPQMEYYRQPDSSKAVAAWDSVQDGFAIEEYLTLHSEDPRSLTDEQLSRICVHPHITQAASAIRLLDVHKVNSPRRILLAREENGVSIRRESISLSDLHTQPVREGKTSRLSQEKERTVDGPNKKY